MMKKAPNMVLICVDQWRGDCLGLSGHPVVKTPFLDQLALQGCRFERAYSATPSCIAARAALMTGLRQESHGRVGYEDGVSWDYPVTLAGEFTRCGYQTQAIGKMHVYPERTQLGFQNVLLHDGFLHFSRKEGDAVDDYLPWLREKLGDPHADYFETGLNCNSNVARPWDKAESLHPTNWAVTQSIDFLRRRDPRKPFFLFLSFHRPHPPYDPPAWAFEQYLAADMPDVPIGDWSDVYSEYESPAPDSPVGRFPPETVRRARAGYYGNMTHIDHQINRFVESLSPEERDNTIICFTSDHGELLGDHHLWRKTLPYEGSARIPLILCDLRPDARQRGRVCNSVAELRDVMPTLLDCAELPIPESVEGRSLLPLASGESPVWRDAIHGEHLAAGGSIQWLTDGHEKYIWMSATGREQLFNLDNDPNELHDRVSEQPERLSHWRARLIELLAEREEGFVQNGSLVSGCPVQPSLAVLRNSNPDAL